MNKKTVLITGGRAPVALEMSRMFAKAGYRVIGAESIGHNLLSLSRAVDKDLRVPSPRFDFQGYKKAIKRLVINEGIDLLVATCEEIFYISQFKDELMESCQVFMPAFEKLSKVHSKWDFIQQAKEVGLKVPSTHRISTLKDATVLLKLYKKVVIKAEYSRFGDTAHFLTDEGGLGVVSRLLRKYNDLLVQEMIEGKQISTYSLCSNGVITVHCAYSSNYTIGPGSFVAFEAEENNEILSWVKTFVERIAFTGQVAFDFILSKEGEVWGIECNPRTTSGIHLLREKVRLDEYFTNLVPERFLSQSTGRAYSLLAMAVVLISKVRSTAQLISWVKFIFSGKEIVFSATDPLPFLSQFLLLGKLCFIARNKGLSITGASTWDIEYNGF